TIRDRLRVLQPSDPENYYRKLDLVPPEHLAALGTAKVVVTNFHAFNPRQTVEAAKVTKALATGRKPNAFRETHEQMAKRVCRELGARKQIVILNDEAHHCYRSNPATVAMKLTGDQKKEADQRDAEARLWLTGLEAIHKKIGVKAAYDLSATPFYLDGSGYEPGTLFGWVVSDFSLIDAIESGIVKIPRVPVLDNTLGGTLPTFRELWLRIRDDLPKKGRTADPHSSPPQPPKELEAALQALYAHYERAHLDWEKDAAGRDEGRTPPVFIVVCNNTNVSKLLFDYVAGYETGKEYPDGAPVVAAGRLPLFSNVDHGRWRPLPNTILVDSAQLESEDGMSADFKKFAAGQLAEFQAEYRRRFPERDEPTDQDLMREVLNTVGKPGKLGESVKCVVSVSMLTEGWDCNTVTHVLGVRAFGTQLLCEQVVGRGLRRASYTLNAEGRFDPEYADVFGVPFQFIPYAGDGTERQTKDPIPKPGRIKAVPERLALRPWLEITYPRLSGYRYEMPAERLTATFTHESRLVLSTADLPTKTISEPIVGESATMTLDQLKARREQEIAFAIAREVLTKYYPADPANDDPAAGAKVWLFPQLVGIVQKWMRECVTLKDNVFPQMLLLAQLGKSAAEKVHRALAAGSRGEARVRAILQPYDALGTSAIVSFDSRRSRFKTDERKC
ncbi:MAG: restriction endonuclease, partial [Gemmataceae bacterium]|nr:restriction endonuclease [Gemmataceae bacterium]